MVQCNEYLAKHLRKGLRLQLRLRLRVALLVKRMAWDRRKVGNLYKGCQPIITKELSLAEAHSTSLITFVSQIYTDRFAPFQYPLAW